jgi:hypothetical protein
MTSDVLIAVLGAVAVLQFKHFICDGPLQTYGMVRDKGFYGRPLGLAHAALHGLGTLIGLGAATAASWGLVAILALADFVVHYHVDFTKETVLRRAGWTNSDAQFWWAFAADQMLHQLTYLVLIYFALRPAL